MSKQKLRKNLTAACLATVMAISGNSLVSGAAQALPNGGIVNIGGVNYLVDAQGERYSGWFIDTDGTWYYFNESDKTMKTGWHYDEEDRHYYYLNLSDGKMVTGWQVINGSEYYFQPIRNMGNYYFDAEQGEWLYSMNGNLPYGAMYQNTITPDGSYVDANGVKMVSANNSAGNAGNVDTANVNTAGQQSLSGSIDYQEYVGEYTLENNYSLQSASSLWLTIAKIENNKIWASVHAGAGSLSGEAYGEVKGSAIENGKFTIVLDDIMPPMMGPKNEQPYSIEFTFSSDKIIDAKVSQCIYEILAELEGKLWFVD